MSPIRTRWRQSSRRAMSSFPNRSKIPMMACVDSSSRTLTATFYFSVVLVHDAVIGLLGAKCQGSMTGFRSKIVTALPDKERETTTFSTQTQTAQTSLWVASQDGPETLVLWRLRPPAGPSRRARARRATTNHHFGKPCIQQRGNCRAGGLAAGGRPAAISWQLVGPGLPRKLDGDGSSAGGSRCVGP